jgi:hypothetical protein
MSEATAQEANEMTTAIAKADALADLGPAAQTRSRLKWRPRLVLAGFVVTLAALSISTSRLQPADGSVGTTGAEPAVTPGLAGSPWLDRLEVINLKKRLVRAGYSIKVSGGIGPVTRSALADYLQLDETHPLSPFLARALSGTVITGRRNPAAWNNYFGLDRPTRLVERPLTGPGMQLDPNGNYRPPSELNH